MHNNKKPIAAAACGLPNIVSASCALVEIVQDGVDGIHVHSDSAENFAQAILPLTESSELRSRMGQAGSQQAVERFSVTAYKMNMLKQLESFLSISNFPQHTLDRHIKPITMLCWARHNHSAK